MRKSKAHITFIVLLHLLIGLFAGILSFSAAPAPAYSKSDAISKHDACVALKFIPGQGIVVTPTKVNEGRTVNCEGGQKYHHYSYHAFQQQISYLQFSSKKQNRTGCLPIYLVSRKLLI